eukprot:365942-Chlamydomonas_euryale.AAC.58
MPVGPDPCHCVKVARGLHVHGLCSNQRSTPRRCSRYAATSCCARVAPARPAPACPAKYGGTGVACMGPLTCARVARTACH